MWSNVVLQIDLEDGENFAVTHSTCECVMGHYQCHHVAAALLFGCVTASTQCH